MLDICIYGNIFCDEETDDDDDGGCGGGGGAINVK
jgi:hypothetical protein